MKLRGINFNNLHCDATVLHSIYFSELETGEVVSRAYLQQS